MSDDESLKLIQILGDLELSLEGVNLYIKMLGEKPQTVEEIETIIDAKDRETCLGMLNELISKGICISDSQNSDSPEDALFYAIPPYIAIHKFYENFNEKINHLAEKLPQDIAQVLADFKLNSGILSFLNNYIEAFDDVKSTVAANINLQKGDYEDTISLILELKEELRSAEGIIDGFEQFFNLQFQDILDQVETIAKDALENLEEYGLSKKAEDLKALLNKVVEEKLSELQFNYKEKIPPFFAKHNENFKKSTAEITTQIDKLEKEFRTTFYDLLEEYESSFSDQEHTIKQVYEKELEKLSNIDETLGEKIFNLAQRIFKIVLSPIRLSAAVLQYLHEKAKSSPIPVLEKTGLEQATEPIPAIPAIPSTESAGASPQQLEEVKLPKTTVKIVKSDNPYAQRFNVVLNSLEDQTGAVISNQLQDIADFILENKGFSVVLNDIRRWVTDLRKQGNLSEGIRRVLEKKIFNWIERLT